MIAKKITLTGIMCLSLLTTHAAFAQFDLKSLTSKVNAPPSGAVANLASLKDKMLGEYLSSSSEWTQGLSKAAEALGIKSDALSNLSVLQSLSKGNLSDATLMAKQKASEAIGAMIQAKLQGSPAAPSTGAKQMLTDGLMHMAKSLQGSQSVLKDSQGLAQKAQTALPGASLADIGKIKDVGSFAGMMAKNLPSDLTSAKGILSHLMDYAKANNINVPSMATSLLK